MNMKQLILPIVLAAGICAKPGAAQQAPATAPSTRQQWQQQVTALQQSVQAQQARVDDMTKQLQAANAEFDGRIERLTDSVSKLTDSKDSGTHVLQMKQSLIASLKKLIDFYNRERGPRLAALQQQYTQIPKQDLERDVAVLDQLIEKRVEDIMKLAESFPVPKDVPRTTYSWDGGSMGTNPEYIQQRHVSSAANLTRDDLAEALKASIENLKRQNQTLERAAQNASTAEERDFYQQRMQQNRQRIDQRRQQITDLMGSGSPGTQMVSTKEYFTIEEQVEDMINELKQEFRAMLKLRNDRDVERERLQILQSNLAVAQQNLAASPQ